MRIAMIGTGYVGLVSGACFADFGFDVICVDIDADKIARLLDGEIPIFEPGLEHVVEAGRRAERLSFTTDLEGAVSTADAVFLAVGTPTDPATGRADLRYVEAAARSIGTALNGYTVIVDKSTVPVGTAKRVEGWIREANPAAEFDVVSNPEFLREGAAVQDFQNPDRVVIGLETDRARDVMSAIYQPLANRDIPILFTGRETAEVIKYAGNAFLALKIGFINEVADLCEAVGADVLEVADGIGLDSRIGPKFLRPGPGYGGSCFPKDTLALVRTGEDAGAPQNIVDSVIRSNAARKRGMGDKIASALGGSLAGRTVGLLGLTFKANTDDMRESPALDIVSRLLELGAVVRAYDPQGMEEAARLLDSVEYCRDSYDAADGADVVAIVTEWSEFAALDLERLRGCMRSPHMVDLRNLIDPVRARAAGLNYMGIGRVI